jgi:O-antigen ligase
MVALQRFPKGDPRTRRVIGALCLFGLVWLVQSFLTPGLTTSNRLSEVVAIALPAATFMVAFRHARDERGLLRLTAAMTFVGALLALIGIAEQRLGFQLARYSGGTVRLQVGLVGAVRITGPYSVPEVYGVTLLACLAATVYWSLIKSGRQRVLGVAAGLLECTAIGFTLFRTFWIGAVIIAVIAFGWRRGRVGRLPLVAIVAVVVAGFAYVQISSTTFGQVRVDNTSDITGRLNIYAVALQEFQRSPVTGVGVGQFVPYQQKLPPTPALVNSRGTLFPHDSFTQVLAEQGLVGFIPLMFVSMALLWVVVSLFRRARRWPDFLLAIVLLSAALSFLLSNLTLDMLPYGQATAIFAALMGAGTGRLDVLLQTSSAPSRIVERTSVRNGERDLVANLLSPKRLR